MEGLLAHGVPLLAGLEFRLLHGIKLQEAIQLSWIAPPPLIMVVADDSAEGIDHDGVLPAGQLYQQPLGFAAVKLSGTVLRRSEVEPLAGSGHSGGIMYFRLQRNKM